MAAMSEAVRAMDGRFWTGIGTVLPAQGGDHFDLHDGQDCTVEVELHPGGRVITARVGSAGGGANQGVWRIPDPGDEVAVLVPDGEEDAGGIITCVLSTGQVPDSLGGALLVRGIPRVIVQGDAEVLVQAPKVVVEADQVMLGGDNLTPLLDGVVLASGIDPFSQSTYGALGNASSIVMARKT